MLCTVNTDMYGEFYLFKNILRRQYLKFACKSHEKAVFRRNIAKRAHNECKLDINQSYIECEP